MYADDLVWPWWEALRVDCPLFDIHTHVGVNDPSGFSATADDVRAALSRLDAGAAVFPLTEPDGYRDANDAVLKEAPLVPFCRVAPGDDPAGEARRCVEAGAAGIKLHPASDGFELDDQELTGVFGLAHELRLPIVVHAGPENDALGDTLLALLDRYSGARFVLAHDGLTDLAWLAGHPLPATLFFDTSWWSPTDLVTLLGAVPPGRVLFGSDIPYSTPTWGAHATARCAMYAGLDDERLASVLGGQSRRLVDRADPLDLGPAPGAVPPLDPLLERLYVYLAAAVEPTKRGEPLGQLLNLARHCCRVRSGHPHRAVFESVRELLDRYEQHAPHLTTGNQYAPGWDLVATAAIVARTPGTPLPDL
ncbi:Predicted metal-dependent hydrolase, TIM-barrel fold [Lentzea fradiae]|uniref:Predicted metal-dependent hydrolase, TIM-barrel fold n=1 Tax=Lentzea fradiae TaxID=200378 RepID=A0A1G7V7W8_9PSEU|nr:amidohydrolase family protein [Lentzea fradiae]SDG55985.1 Predicted metal-dependent hydrolase, TIM-barrel fold [Lentzea fradiae]